MSINVTLRRIRVTTVAEQKLYVLHILTVFVALGMQHAMPMGHIVMCGLPRFTVFFHVNLKTARFSGGGEVTKLCVLIFPTNSVLILRLIQRDIFIKAHRYKVPLFSSDFNAI